MNIFCDLTNGQFATAFRDRTEPRYYLAQNNDLPLRLYLLQALNSPRWPYSYDSWSGAPAVTAIVSLRDLLRSPIVTLASTAPLNLIPHGFEGLLHTNTVEVAQLLATRSEAPAALCVDLVDGSGNKINPFRRDIILRAQAGATPSALGTILYFPEVTAYLGTGPEALASKPTLGRTGVIFEAVINGILASWRVQPGAATSDLDQGIIRPGDFNASTNPVNLIRVGGI